MGGWWPWYRPTVLTRRGRQLEMQNWRCCFCGGRHAFWFHDHPGRDGGGRPVIPAGAQPGAGEGDGGGV